MAHESHPAVLITGAGRGLGRGIALRLSGLGMSVAVNYARDAASAEETVQLCIQQRTGGQQRFLAVQGDVGIEDDRARIVARTLEAMGRIDALVNNAGVGPAVRADITETTEESFEQVLRTNLHGPFFLTQRVVNYWLREKPGPQLSCGFAVIFNSSISAAAASVNRAEYCISKAGLSMASRAWALRLASEGIVVYELRPGIMATDMTSAVRERYDAQIAQGLVPQRRWGTAEDAGRAVGALLTGAFPFSTGSVIHIDGGFHLERL